MKKVFVVGNANSIWIREYIKNVHCKLNHKVFLTAYEPVDKDYLETYENLGVNIVQLYDSDKSGGKLTKGKKLLKFAISNRHFDVIDLQSPPHNFQTYVLNCIFGLLKGPLVISFWGSDILAINDDEAKTLMCLLKRAKKINLPSKEMEETFEKFFQTKYAHKYVCGKYGSLAYDYIDNIKSSMSKADCKSYFDLNTNKITVMIGHNGIREQQHLAVIEQLTKLDKVDKDKLQVVIHMNFFFDEEYFKEIQSALEHSGIEYKMIVKKMDLLEIAKLRLATDIFIHAQTVDALSGSVREALYAGEVLIHGSWVKYSELDESGVEYVKYDTFDQLNSRLKDVLYDNLEIDRSSNLKILRTKYSWESVLEGWKAIFDEDGK